MRRVMFQPWGVPVDAADGETLLAVARRAGVPLQADCGGEGRCGSCRVQVRGQERPAGVAAQEGLACQLQVGGDATVQVPPESRVHAAGPRKPFTRRQMRIRPCVSRLVLELPAAGAGAEATLGGRIRRALAAQLSKGCRLGLPVLAEFSQQPGAHRASQVTATLYRGREVVCLRPGDRPGLYGLALDLGTTSLVAFLCDLGADRIVGVESAVNPQFPYGEDVISRIAKVQMDPRQMATLRGLLLDAVDALVARLTKRAGVDREAVVDVVAVGNPTMQHFFLGLNPQSLGQAPFAPVCREGGEVLAGVLGVGVCPQARVHLLPTVAGFVGADLLAALLPLGAQFYRGTNLLLDVGTNGEVVLAQSGKLLATSCATGPAFEGAHIRCGMRAAPGAIEMVSCDDRGHIHYRTIGSPGEEHASAPLGLCGSGVISAVASLLGAGLLRADGAFALEQGYPALRVDPTTGVAEAVLVPAQDSGTGRDIVLSQSDVRDVQLGKAALRAGVEMLMQEHGVTRIDRVYLAGTFGNHLAAEDVIALGMLPPVAPERIVSIGNAAGDGARMALFSKAVRQRARELAKRIRVLELTRRADFQQTFVDCMSFGPCAPT